MTNKDQKYCLIVKYINTIDSSASIDIQIIYIDIIYQLVFATLFWEPFDEPLIHMHGDFARGKSNKWNHTQRKNSFDLDCKMSGPILDIF